MTSTIKVNNIQNQCGQNIINENSNTITIGASGDTIALASGASQSGFGRTGTVDWQTGDIKTSTFTAESGKGYFCDTNGGAFEVDLPAGTAGAIVSVQDYRNTFDTNELTVDPNGSEKINGGTAGGSVTLDTEGEGITLVYIDATVGWRSIQDNTFSDTGSVPTLISATGGTITTCGDFKIHTFTGPGTFCVASGNGPIAVAEYIVVAGGGGGGGGYGGGGGAGGFRFAGPTLAPLTYPGKPLSTTGQLMSPGPYAITVGGGGSGSSGSTGSGDQNGTKGGPSSFVASTATITSAGGGVGAMIFPVCNQKGGSGGGGSVSGPGTPQQAGGSGNQPPVSPAQGTNGGTGYCGGCYGQGGGGGALVAGTNGTTGDGGAGGAGAGIPTAFGSNGVPCGSYRYYAGGGGGGRYGPSGNGGGGAVGGVGGGGRGDQPAGAAGTTNSGGGGGGANARQPNGYDGGNGGSGIVIIRYKFQ
jgi:hypothetical protein|tara:strand:+ start:1116 stop:2534 length:1419 start_codon:yes stop_codon:yes gene_type:complete